MTDSTTKYYDLNLVKQMLDLTSTNDYDDLLDSLGTQADRNTDNAIQGFVDSVPLTGTEITDDVRLASNLFVCYLFAQMRLPEAARNFHSGYQQVIARIKKFEVETVVYKSTGNINQID